MSAEYPESNVAGPPLGGVAPPLQCNRIIDGTFEAPVHCGAEGKWHVIWNLDAENGICCDKHADEVRRRWVYVGFHPYEMVCSIQGAHWLHDEDRCVVTDDDLGLTEAALASVANPSPCAVEYQP